MSTNKREEIVTLTEAQEKAAQVSNIESHPYVIWWVMDRGYVVLPQGERPTWLFAAEEETVYPPTQNKKVKK